MTLGGPGSLQSETPWINPNPSKPLKKMEGFGPSGYVTAAAGKAQVDKTKILDGLRTAARCVARSVGVVLAIPLVAYGVTVGIPLAIVGGLVGGGIGGLVASEDPFDKKDVWSEMKKGAKTGAFVAASIGLAMPALMLAGLCAFGWEGMKQRF